MKKEKIKLKLNGKEIAVQDVERCERIWTKARGLMFRKNPHALLFIFDKPGRRKIHSFFCEPFIAVWLIGGEIVEAKVVSPWKLSVCPKAKFDKLLEVPLENNKGVLDFLVENKKI